MHEKSIMRRLSILLVLLLLFMLGGCHEKRDERLRVGISPWPGYEPLVLGVEKDLYEGVDVRIIRYATPSESFRALRDGVVDVAAFTADEVLHYAELSEKPKMFLVVDVSNGGDAIVARPEIKSLSQLKGKCVGTEASALGDYVINRAMDFAEGVSIDDITLLPVETIDQLQMYREGRIDALVTYEPYRTKLINEGAHVIFDSTQLPNEIVDVLVTNSETLQLKKNTIKALVDGWYRTIDFIREHREESMEAMASYEYIDKSDFETAFNTLTIPSRTEVRQMLTGRNNAFGNALERLAGLMQEKGSIEMHPDTASLIEGGMIGEDK